MPRPLPIQGLHHVALVTIRLDESVAFYRDLLGFQELSRPPFNFRGAWLYAYGFQIHIIENPRKASQSDGAIDTRANHLAFRTVDADLVKQRLAEQQITYIEQVNAGGMHQIFFQDPDGHHVEVSVAGDPSIGYEGT